jgi:Ca-activated chloride channel homolog
MLLLDVSGSMFAILPEVAGLTPSRPATRLDVAKRLAADLVRHSTTDRIGIAVFAKECLVLSAPTLDHADLLERVSSVSLGMVEGDGTDVGGAILRGVSALEERTEGTRIAVLLSDADPGTEGTSPAEAAVVATAEGVRLVTVQFGMPGPVELQSGVDQGGHPVFAHASFDANPGLFMRIAAEHRGKHLVVRDEASFAAAIGIALAP